jgi:hypothetical protein
MDSSQLTGRQADCNIFSLSLVRTLPVDSSLIHGRPKLNLLTKGDVSKIVETVYPSWEPLV